MRRGLGQRLAIGGGLLGLAIVVLLPFWFVATGSVKAPQEIIARVPTLVPQSFTLRHFDKLLGASDYPRYLGNSLVVGLGSTAITVVLSVLAAYGFYRLRFPGRDLLFRAVLVAYAFPGILILIPLYGMMSQAGLIDTPAALVIVNVTFASPFAIWMMRSFFASIPAELEEAALIDGASRLAILLRIMVPLAAPGIASVAIFAFIASWTEYLFASVLILSDANRTLPVGFAGIIGQYQIDWGLLLAGATLATVPVVLLFGIVGRWFIAGLTAGAVK
ncbi:carbohydrate ABC transporter permease [Mycobacterium sp. KBS0706]|uniref:carbohydrate ABC transporter permease n=1 Tax=Mycobacterium sp. KBS0706 TaxID=2578109 RepID=UPI00110F6BFD|nr:carbohydrate ABC transporter permease [Mycobacterium sp. KBS0706]TSD89247.1 carbohydrate ABC transporter permease [Mycobacterium sp. KBS0706]